MSATAVLTLVMAGFVVQMVGVFFRRPPPLANTAVSALAGLALALVRDPFTWIFFVPTVDGLVAATLLAFSGGFLFHVAYDMGHRR